MSDKMKKNWKCWIVVEDIHTGDLKSEGPFTATTLDVNYLDVLTSLFNRFLTEPSEGSDNHILDFKVGYKE